MAAAAPHSSLDSVRQLWLFGAPCVGRTLPQTVLLVPVLHKVYILNIDAIDHSVPTV